MISTSRTLFLFVTSLVFFISSSVFADSNKHHHHKNKQFFLAPDITNSGSLVNGVDVASGKLNRSDTDLTSSSLSFSRVYSGSGLKALSIGGWNHAYASKLLVGGLSYGSWDGVKSQQYNGKSRACASGWNDIKDVLFNGQLSSAKAKYRHGICQITMSNKAVAEFIVHSKKKSGNDIVLSRPDGSTISFVKSGRHWKNLSGAPFSLVRSGKNWKISTPSDSTELYNRNGKLIKMTNAGGQATRLQYRGGKLNKITGAFGKTLELSYQNGKLNEVVGALGTVSYTYANNSLSTVTKVDGSTMSYQYDNDRLSSITDALGQTTASYSYDAQNRVASFEGQGVTRETTYEYNGADTAVMNVANNASDTYSFGIVRGIAKNISMTNVAGSSSTQTYDNNGYPYESTAINGTKSRTIYNDKGLLVKRIESVGLANEKITLTDWHADFRKPILQIEDELAVGNKVTESEYNRKGLLVKRVEGVIASITHSHHHGNHHNYGKNKKKGHKSKHHKGHGHHNGHNHKPTIVLKDKRITRYRYNNKGQVVKTIAPNGAITLTSYDAQGNRTCGANALGHENKTLSFDVTGKPLVSESANGIQTTNEYDSAGRLISTTSNSGTTHYAYDASGRQTGVTNPDGSTTANEYDAAGNLTKTIDQDGNVSLSTFDSNGNQTSTQVTDDKDDVILSSASEYNNQNQLVKSIDAQGNETTYVYDTSGNQIQITDTNGNVSQNEYDANNRLVKTIDALNGETVYVYNTDGNRTSVIAPNGATTTFAYDSYDQMTNEVSADRGTTTYQYDGSGNQVSVTDANGNQKNISYDALNRKTGESWTDAPDLTIAYTYDSCDNGIGKLCAITDKSGSTSFVYDIKGQVAQKTQNIEGIELTKTYVYNNEGKLTSETYPSGAVIAYAYNVDDIESISINGHSYITDFAYNAANQLTSWNWADGTSYTKTYDANGRLASFPLGNETRTLNYDSNGNITGWNDTGSDEAKSFAYDALNRLTDYNKANTAATLETQGFTYDANGNRLELLDDSVQTVYSILGNSNRLAQVDATTYQYDANGNITDDGEHTYSYDSRNRLTGVDGTSSYLFNANNMRVKKTTPAATVLYAWDNDRIFAEYDDKGDVIQETVYFGSTPVALLKDGQVYKVFSDQVNSPRILVDESSITVWAWDNKPFGESKPQEDVDGDGTHLTYNLRFAGQYYDVETSKHYNYNRDYNPLTGRYVQSDPIGLNGGMNSYVYVSGNPMINTDYNGLRSINVTNPYTSAYADLDGAIKQWQGWACAINAIAQFETVRTQIDYYQRTTSIYARWYYLLYETFA